MQPGRCAASAGTALLVRCAAGHAHPRSNGEARNRAAAPEVGQIHLVELVARLVGIHIAQSVEVRQGS